MAEQAVTSAQTPGAGAPSPFVGAAWGAGPITWNFADGGMGTPFSSSVAPRYRETIEKAVRTWASVADLRLEQVQSAATADIHVGFYDFHPQDTGLLGCTATHQGNGALQSGGIIQLEDPSEDALVRGKSGDLTYAAQDVTLSQLALHEVGHALGLADTADPHSIMYAELGAANRTLDETDIANIRSLYGQPLRSSADTTDLLVQAMAIFDPPASTPVATVLPHPTQSPVMLAAANLH